MTWLDEGEWGPSGDPDTDFPPDTQVGELYNKKNKKEHRLSGAAAATVGQACRVADEWLQTSQFRVGMGEYVIALLQQEGTGRALTDVERTTLSAAADGCDELRRGWNGLGAQLMKAIKVCQAEEEHDALNSTEDCRRLRGRLLLARNRGESQIGAGIPPEELAKPGAPQPGCVAIQAVMHNLRRGAR